MCINTHTLRLNNAQLQPDVCRSNCNRNFKHCDKSSTKGNPSMLQAIYCGIFGALASIAGKLALSDSSLLIGINAACSANFDGTTCNLVLLVSRMILFGVMLLLNATMVASFLKSMERNASVIVTVLSTGSNYVLTGFLGRVIFDEKLGSWWLVGSTLICFGMCLIGVSQEGIPKLRAR